MADEYSKPPYNREVGIAPAHNWQSLRSKRGAELEGHYIELLRELSKKKGMLGQIFTKSQNKIQDPAKLSRLIEMIDSTDWVMMGADVKGDIYEGLLEKNAEDTKSGAGQYFTPRSLIRAMVECVRPEPGKTIADPACGTGGFFLAAYDFITEIEKNGLDKKQKEYGNYFTDIFDIDRLMKDFSEKKGVEFSKDEKNLNHRLMLNPETRLRPAAVVAKAYLKEFLYSFD